MLPLTFQYSYKHKATSCFVYFCTVSFGSIRGIPLFPVLVTANMNYLLVPALYCSSYESGINPTKVHDTLTRETTVFPIIEICSSKVLVMPCFEGQFYCVDNDNTDRKDNNLTNQ